MSDTDRKGKDGRGAWPLLVGLPLILAVAVAAVLFSGSGERSRPAGQEQAPQPAEEKPARGGAELGHPALGSEDAPVVMIEYGDFQ